MAKPKKKKVFYYDDELNNDFARMNLKHRRVDGNFKYLHKSWIWNACAFALYYFVAVPIIWFYTRVILGVRYVNKSALRPYRKTPCFLYGNHTGWVIP